ncbi:MAG: hypothetical protein CVV25_07155 [Ignavibacteriae bacterium HGW-Ignavibacteriae-4]|nr:MAG: hypothetical protein CVV25_07155 [Ignavibacteriae bacterium HGW-Ignavibacteriae-4]
MKKIIITLLMLATLPFSSYAGPKEIMQVGEKLKYEVSFLGVKLGTIEMSTNGTEDYNGKKVYLIQSDIKTYDGIPFVDLKATFNAWFDQSMNHSHKFTSNMKKDDKTWEYQQLLMDYDKMNLHLKIWENKNVTKEEDIKLKAKVNDGSSLFFLARQYTGLKRSIKVPTVIDGQLFDTKLNFRDKTESVEISKIDYPVRTKYFDGQADWEGLYGLSGRFEGWFSDDEASVPILAKMNVYVGKVNIELIEWTRKGWTPPKGN